MTLSKAIFLPLLAVVILSLSSCGTFRRLGKDVYIATISPGLILMAASTDAYNGSVDVREGYGGDGATQVIAMPLMFAWHFLKHSAWVGIHIVDIPLNLAYGISEIGKFGPEIEPIDFYGNTIFDTMGKRSAGKSSTDSESGQETGK